MADLPDLTEHRVSGETVYDGGFMRLERDVVRTPGDRTAERLVVRHCGAVAIVPLFANGDLLLIRQYRYPVGCHSLEVPAGKLDVTGEDPLACARRELVEETGHAAARWEEMCVTHSSVGFTDETLRVYVAHDITPVTRQGGEDDEFTHPVRITLADARRRFSAGEIREARTQLALLWLSLREAGLPPAAAPR